MRYWWVNQNQTYDREVPGGFMWSPKKKKNGMRNEFYDNMGRVAPGDVVFSFAGTRIRAIGVVRGEAETAEKPDFGSAGSGWSKEGWFVPVEFRELKNQISPRLYLDQIRPHLPQKYAPIQRETGNGLQSVYLAEVPRGMAEILQELIGEEFGRVVTSLQLSDPGLHDREALEIQIILERTDIGATEKERLIKARRGQGVFKSNVRLHEQACRVTRISEVDHLIASHIKPWSVSDDCEKIDGCNGLLLSPHIDHLFDRGFISFSKVGDLLVSPRLKRSVLAAWGVQLPLNVGSFTERQHHYLEYHRNEVFKP